MVQLNTHGNCWVAKYRDSSGQILQLGCLHPERVQVRIVRGEPIYTYSPPKGPQMTLTTRDIVQPR